MRFSHHCFGFQSQRFLLLVGYNTWPCSSSTNQNAAWVIDHCLDLPKKKLPAVTSRGNINHSILYIPLSD